MVGLLTAADAGVATAVITGLFTLLALLLRKAHAVGGEVTAVAEEARTAVNEARDEAVEARVVATAVKYQLQPNGGSSLRDAIDRLEERQTGIGELADRLASVADRIDARTLVLDQRLTATARSLDERLTAIEKVVRP